MPEHVESRETDAFTGNGTTSGQQKSKSYLDLRKKNNLMKIGIIALIVFILLLLLIIIVVAIVKVQTSKEEGEDDHSNDPDVCHTKECVETAKYFYENMDLSVDPCEDFYNYSCRGWGIHNPRPAGEDQWGVNTLVEKNLKKQLLDIVEGTDKVPSSMQKARNFYKACINLEFRDEYGLEELHKLFKKVGGFPMITENWNDANFDWQKNYVYIDTQINCLSVFFTYKVERISEEEKNQYIILSPADSFFVGQTLNNPDAKREEKLEAEKDFRDNIREYLKNLRGYIVDENSLDRDIKAFIDFEKKLATLVQQSQDDGSEDVIPISEMQTKYKDVDWSKLFGDIFITANINITKDDKIYINNALYFKEIGKLLKETPKRVLANYISYNILTEFGPKAIFNFEQDEDKTIDMKGLKESCTTETEKFFRVAMNYWYMKTILGKESMHDLKGFLKTIKAALTLTINTNTWMDEKTKQAAQLKLNKMLSYIASPSEIKNDNELDDYYKHTGFISNENFVYDFKKMSKWSKYRELRKLRETEDKEVTVPTEVNSYYTPYDNKIQILIGFLSKPNFYPGAPLAINVPAIGSTIGHEVTHGFDTTGSQFDSKGIKHNWWDKKTQSQYEKKVDCFIEQYSAFVEPITGKHINGKLSVGENIADNGAIHQTYTAYKIYASLKHPEKDLKLPGEMSRFTKDQQFFISYANTYCNDHSARMINAMLRDVHAPDAARVIVPLQNSEEFARAFNCKKGSTMNPVKKCILW